MKAFLCFMAFGLLLPVTPIWAIDNDTPGAPIAVVIAPLTANLGSAHPTPIQAFVWNHFQITALTNESRDYQPRVSIIDVDAAINRQPGCGWLWGFTHTDSSLFEVETYPGSAEMDCWLQLERLKVYFGFQDTELEMNTHLDQDDNPIYHVIDATGPFFHNRFVNNHSVVQIHGCASDGLRSSFPGFRAFLGYTPCVLSNVVFQDTQAFWERISGVRGITNRTISVARAACNSNFKLTGAGNTVISPTMTVSVPQQAHFHGPATITVKTDCPMSSDVTGELYNIVRGTGAVQLTGISQENSTTFKVGVNRIGTQTGAATVTFVAYNPAGGVQNGFRTAANIGLNGNSLGLNGINENGDSYVLGIVADDNPASDVSGFRAVWRNGGVDLSWVVGVELGTQRYRVKHSSSQSGPSVLADSIQAGGGYATYHLFIPGATDRYWELEEVDTRGQVIPYWNCEVEEDLQLSPFNPPSDAQADSIRTFLSEAVSMTSVQRPTDFTGWEYLIYAPRAWIADADQQAAIFNWDMPSKAFAIEDVAAGRTDTAQAIKDHIASIPTAKDVLLDATSFSNLWKVDSIWTKGYVRPPTNQYRPRPQENFIPMNARLTSDSAQVSEFWSWCPYACNDYWYIGDSLGLPRPGLAISRALVTTPAEAAAFNLKTYFAKGLNPGINTVGLWQRAKDAFGNSGQFSKEIGDSIIAALPPMVSVNRILDDYTTNYTNAQRDQLAIQSLEQGQGTTFAVSPAARWDYAATFLNLPSGCRLSDQTPNQYALSYLVSLCGLGGHDYAYPDSIGPGIMRQAAVDPYRNFWGGFVANRGVPLDGWKTLILRWIKKEYVLNNQPSAAKAAADAVREIATEHPELLEMCLEMNCYGPTPLRIPFVAPYNTVRTQHQPGQLKLLPVCPNPIRGSATFSFVIAQAGQVNLGVFDPMGRRVATVLNGQHQAGRHTVQWRNNLPSGVYFLKLRSADQSAKQKIELVR